VEGLFVAFLVFDLTCSPEVSLVLPPDGFGLVCFLFLQLLVQGGHSLWQIVHLALQLVYFQLVSFDISLVITLFLVVTVLYAS